MKQNGCVNKEILKNNMREKDFERESDAIHKAKNILRRDIFVSNVSGLAT